MWTAVAALICVKNAEFSAQGKEDISYSKCWSRSEHTFFGDTSSVTKGVEEYTWQHGKESLEGIQTSKEGRGRLSHH